MTVSAGLVERDADVRPIVQDPADEPTQDGAGADLDEEPRPGLVHGLDLGDEPDRPEIMDLVMLLPFAR